MFTLLKKKLRSSAAACVVMFAGLPVFMASTTVNATTLTFETIVLEGDQGPGALAGSSFSFVGRPSLNNQGEIAFETILTGAGITGANDSAIFSDVGGTLSLVAREGDAAPGAGAGVSFTRVSGLSLNDQGEIAFRAGLTGTGVDGTNNTAIFSDVGGTLSLVAREGDAAPGAGAGVSLSVNGFPSLNNQGGLAFQSSLRGEGVTLDNSVAIFRESGGNLSLVAREGDAAPGAGAGEVFSLFLGSPVLNDQGETAFLSFIRGSVLNSNNDTALFSDVGGTLSLVAREGDAAPGARGARFGDFNGLAFDLNDQGEIAFVTRLTGTNDDAIFSDVGGTLSLVAREGDAAPGAGDGVFFRDFGGNTGSVRLNNQSEIAFVSILQGTGVTFANDTAIFSGSNGMLSLLVREGDIIDLGNGDLANIIALSIGAPVVLNDLGEVAFFADLSDGRSGLFLASPDGVVVSPVPIPAALPLMASGLLGLVAIARRRKSALS